VRVILFTIVCLCNLFDAPGVLSGAAVIIRLSIYVKISSPAFEAARNQFENRSSFLSIVMG
jgi:hypothetical protein